MSSISYDIPYNEKVRNQTSAQLKKKIKSEPQAEHYEIPSVHRVQNQTRYKDRTKIAPDMSNKTMLGNGRDIKSDGSEAQHVGGAKCVKCMGRPKGGRISGGRDTSSGAGRDTSSGAGLSHPIGLPKPVLRKGRGKAEKPSKEQMEKLMKLMSEKKGAGFLKGFKQIFKQSPVKTLKEMGDPKNMVEALKQTGDIIGKAAPVGAAALAGLEGGPAASIAAYKGTKAQVDQAKKLAGSGMDKRKKRGMLVSKLMKERGVSLAGASKIIKAEGLM